MTEASSIFQQHCFQPFSQVLASNLCHWVLGPLSYRSKIVEMSAVGAKQAMSTHLEHGDFQADIYVNTQVDPQVFHYIITRKGDDPEIKYWGQETSVESARREAMYWMVELHQRASASSA